jgi:SAM-dependent methyltransferase
VAIHPSAAPTKSPRVITNAPDRTIPTRPDGGWRIGWICVRGRKVVDIAPWTGKLTRALVATGAKVVAAEPVGSLREQLAAVLLDVEVLDGVAEAIPLDDAAVDAATIGQAFHRFDGDRALLEIQRVAARPCCRLAVVYNRSRLSNPLQAALDAILRPLHEQTPAHRGGRWRDAFARTRLWTAVEGAELPHVQLLDREGVVARAASSSFIAALPSERRAAVLDQVRGAVKRRAEPIELPTSANYPSGSGVRKPG